MHLVIRADGSPEIGYGHLIRSNALAEGFLGRNHEVTVATTTPQPAQSVFPDAADILDLPSRGDPDPFVDWLDANQPDAVFTDSYTIDTEYQRAIRDRVPLVVLQDDDRHAICADLFINGNLYAPDLNYEFVGDEPDMCLGADYVLLRSKIRNRAKYEPPWREQPERALVTMGGSDITNLTPTAVRAFDKLGVHVDAILGPGFSDKQERSVRIAAKEISADVSITRDPDDLVERMFQADFGVCTASSTIYELLVLGTPLVCLPVADNQQPIAAALDDRDAGIVLDQYADKAAIHSALATYTTEPETRQDRRERGRSLVDGQGTKRVARKLAGLP